MKKPVNNLVMVTKQFAEPVYIGPSTGLRATDFTMEREIDKAEKWFEMDRSKLKYYKAITGWELEFETV